MKFSSFKHFCCESKSVAIYALCPESFCMKNLAIQKVFAFSDSDVTGHKRQEFQCIVVDKLQFDARKNCNFIFRQHDPQNYTSAKIQSNENCEGM